MNALTHKAALAQLVAHNPNVIAAWIASHSHAQTLEILADSHHVPGHLAVTVDGKSVPIIIPQPLAKLPYNIEYAAPFQDLRERFPLKQSFNMHQHCQDEPVALGTQIQPAGAPWVGTAGLPVKWLSQAGEAHWGILSNWHVMCPTPTLKGHKQHQPIDDRPEIAHLADWSPVTRDGINYLDAAVADAYVDGFHTISPRILQIGEPGQVPDDARPGMMVIKSGRTTAITHARCKATGAAVKVSYGDFEATFIDQDVFEQTDGAFSAPGDSGSCILTEALLSPTSLLFAGGGNLTIGSPIRYAVQRFNLIFPFN